MITPKIEWTNDYNNIGISFDFNINYISPNVYDIDKTLLQKRNWDILSVKSNLGEKNYYVEIRRQYTSSFTNQKPTNLWSVRGNQGNGNVTGCYLTLDNAITMAIMILDACKQFETVVQVLVQNQPEMLKEQIVTL
jgi:inhibitor of KinA sporulation pathway (predicted exonuclease)